MALCIIKISLIYQTFFGKPLLAGYHLQSVKTGFLGHRVGDYRVFYVVDEDAHRVDVLRVMHKDQTLPYYKELK